MGTLFNQPPRNFCIKDHDNVSAFLDEIEKLAIKHDISFETALEAFKIKEMERMNNLYVNNGNIHDEQMAGIGKLLESLIEAVYNLKDEFNQHK